MLKIIRCGKCNGDLGFGGTDWHDKVLTITLNISRYYKKCKECHHMDKADYSLCFCSIECLKSYVAGDLDKVIKEKVYWENAPTIPMGNSDT